LRSIFVYAIATLALISLGLAIVFGMMRIINLAHGEFMVMGSYSAAVAVHYGINIWLAILVVAPISVGIIGVILERLIIRHLYGRMVETMLATWGLSLFVVGILTMIFGDITEGVPTPLPGIRIGAYQTSGYSLFVIALAIATLFAVYVILRSSRLGLLARGTMQNADMAAALGTDTSRIYAVTFAFGAALAGLAGGVLASLGRVPHDRRLLYRPRFHHRHQRRRGAACRHSFGFSPVRRHQPDCHLSDQSGLRRSGAPARSDRSDPHPAPGNHRTLFPGEPMIATLRANWGLVAVGLLGVALMIILPLTLDLFELLQITL